MKTEAASLQDILDDLTWFELDLTLDLVALSLMSHLKNSSLLNEFAFKLNRHIGKSTLESYP